MNKLLDRLAKETEGWDDGADELHHIVGELKKAASGNRFTRLFRKGGEFSVTRAILIAAWVLGLLLYLFGSLNAGYVIPFLGVTVPAFNSGDFIAVTGAASTLYFANHNIRHSSGGKSTDA